MLMPSVVMVAVVAVKRGVMCICSRVASLNERYEGMSRCPGAFVPRSLLCLMVVLPGPLPKNSLAHTPRPVICRYEATCPTSRGRIFRGG